LMFFESLVTSNPSEQTLQLENIFLLSVN